MFDRIGRFITRHDAYIAMAIWIAIWVIWLGCSWGWHYGSCLVPLLWMTWDIGRNSRRSTPRPNQNG